MKKVLALFLAVAIAAFGIAGCTKKVEPAPVASSSPSASEPAEKAVRRLTRKRELKKMTNGLNEIF